MELSVQVRAAGGIVWKSGPVKAFPLRVRLAVYQTGAVAGAGPWTKNVAKMKSWLCTRLTPQPASA